jgi:glycosyltransferase involved in cell wall biosynthesis
VKVVMVMPEPPNPEGGAAGRCAAGLLAGLSADERVELSAIAARFPEAAEDWSPCGVPVEVVPVPHQNRLEAWSDLVRRPLGNLSRGEFEKRVRRLAADADVFHLDQVHTAWCGRGSGVPALLHLHYLVELDRPERQPDLPARASRFANAAAQRNAIRRHRFLVANSAIVAAELRRRAPQADVTVVPLVLDPDRYGPACEDTPRVAGFIGSAKWPTTAAATHRLVERVWPLVRREVPDGRLLIAGRDMAELKMNFTDGVEILGRVDSAASFLRSVSLLLFPAVRGSGTKVKVLEALACGLPVVTTAVGAEGIAPNDGVIVVEDDASLARAAASILRDDEERKQRSAAALRTFAEYHSPAVAASAFVELYGRIAESG